jgi:RNA polymerase sigma factor (sigma-70 family)
MTSPDWRHAVSQDDDGGRAVRRWQPQVSSGTRSSPDASHPATHSVPRPRGPLEPSELARFEAAVLPHLDAAYTLARYLTRDRHDAEDAVQDAYLRALRYFDGFRGGDSRAWLLAIVRNSCYTLRQRHRREARSTEFDEEVHTDEADVEAADAALLRGATRASLEEALLQLPREFREVIVLRELQGLTYKEISEVAGVPVGTVMSRLARARQRLQRALGPYLEEMR